MKHSTSESYSITRCASKTVKPILTNEEWFCGLSTEEKAKIMCDIYEMGKNGKQYFMRLDKCVEWLKQPYKPFS